MTSKNDENNLRKLSVAVLIMTMSPQGSEHGGEREGWMVIQVLDTDDAIRNIPGASEPYCKRVLQDMQRGVAERTNRCCRAVFCLCCN